MDEIIFYGKENCPKCERAKGLFESRNLDYKLVLIGKDIPREKVLEKFPHAKTVPFFVVGDNYFNDFFDMVKHFGGVNQIG